MHKRQIEIQGHSNGRNTQMYNRNSQKYKSKLFQEIGREEKKREVHVLVNYIPYLLISCFSMFNCMHFLFLVCLFWFWFKCMNYFTFKSLKFGTKDITHGDCKNQSGSSSLWLSSQFLVSITYLLAQVIKFGSGPWILQHIKSQSGGDRKSVFLVLVLLLISE